MKDKKNPYTGIIPVEGANITFYLDNYMVTFMATNHQIHQFDNDMEFVFGQTHGYQGIAIYKGDLSLSCVGAKKLNTCAYIIAPDNALEVQWENYDYIEFSGGTLDNLFFCNAVERDNFDSKEIIFQIKDDTESHNFFYEGNECELIIRSNISECIGLKGSKFVNEHIILGLRFSVPQPLNSVFKHVSNIKKLLSFMTYRQNVGFDEIYMFHNERRLSKMQLFIKEAIEYTNKDIMKNITFHELSNSLSELLSIFYENEKKLNYEFGFLPTDDKDLSVMNNQKVRTVCSALEYELSLIEDLCIEENKKLQELISDIKGFVKKHKKGEDKLSERTYNLIFSNIKHWTMTISDRIYDLFCRYEQEMCLLNPSGIVIGFNEINDFIKYRNNITHGGQSVMDMTIATTAYVLSGLVYCCLLTRAGLERSKILELCKRKKLIH